MKERKWINRAGFWTGIFVFSAALLTSASQTVWAQKADARLAVAQAQPLNINQAAAEDLEKIKGIGPSLAERIVTYRQDNGPFKSVDDLKAVKGIGEAKFSKMKNSLTV